MNDHELSALWKTQALDTSELSLDTVRAVAHGFYRDISRRNRREEWACHAVLVGFGCYAVFLPEFLLRLGSGLIALGSLVILHQLRRRAAIAALPAASLASSYICYFRAELVRQRDALRSVWLWYIGPVVPGLALFVAGMANLADGVPYPLLAMFVIPFVAVIGINLLAAHKLQQKIEALDAAAR